MMIVDASGSVISPAIVREMLHKIRLTGQEPTSVTAHVDQLASWINSVIVVNEVIIRQIDKTPELLKAEPSPVTIGGVPCVQSLECDVTRLVFENENHEIIGAIVNLALPVEASHV